MALPRTAIAQPRRLPSDHLPNAFALHPKVISGGLPEGDAAFAELAARGVKTVISVDGATPDVATAQKYGLRYVHLPHGYDGIPGQRALDLAKAVRELPGPIYVHCHHGKHRSPAAAAVACVGAGLIGPASAEAVLKTAGTSENYRGLYAAALKARPQDAGELAALPAEFPAIAKIPPLAEAMVAIEHLHDNLLQAAAAGWKAPARPPDLDLAHAALLLREQFREMLRTEETQRKPERFRAYTQQGETAAEEMETALRADKLDAAAAALKNATDNCHACHREFRDNPATLQR